MGDALFTPGHASTNTLKPNICSCHCTIGPLLLSETPGGTFVCHAATDATCWANCAPLDAGTQFGRLVAAASPLAPARCRQRLFRRRRCLCCPLWL